MSVLPMATSTPRSLARSKKRLVWYQAASAETPATPAKTSRPHHCLAQPRICFMRSPDHKRYSWANTERTRKSSKLVLGSSVLARYAAFAAL
eukprot:13844032-Alexandrium_andersonii.AAC.1